MELEVYFKRTVHHCPLTWFTIYLFLLVKCRKYRIHLSMQSSKLAFQFSWDLLVSNSWVHIDSVCFHTAVRSTQNQGLLTRKATSDILQAWKLYHGATNVSMLDDNDVKYWSQRDAKDIPRTERYYLLSWTTRFSRFSLAKENQRWKGQS